jgi:hypothetical protein
MSLTLDNSELRELTGKRRPTSIVQWLRQNGFTFRISADGYPRVDRQHYLKMMGGETLQNKRRREPNFDAMQKKELDCHGKKTKKST